MTQLAETTDIKASAASLTDKFGFGRDVRREISKRLQSCLTDWIAIALQLKQAHWNLVGPQFRAVHEQLDEIEADVRLNADELAERIVTLGESADGRPDTVAGDNHVEALPLGRLDVGECVEALVSNIGKVVGNAREVLPKLGEEDPISEDVLIAALRNLEKHDWMLRSLIGI
ncbi:MAG: DNA starvation/stationary phase protection protein [Planctomycetes bacterium]|nr:DNA starvation/stationary phase protection protein [Planctomycetota bacterium]